MTSEGRNVQEIDLPIRGIHCIVDLWIDDYCKPRFFVLFGRSLSSTRYADYLRLLLLSVGVFTLLASQAIGPN